MSTNVVNLDALIPREDFAIDASASQGTPLEKISVVHLEGPFFGPDLRKPDFQRETVQWTPAKVVDLVRAVVDADLIPAVILWRAGRYIFVIDGAHRLSALLAWIFDDYGDRKRSLEFFGGYISDEQRKIAKRTREMVNSDVGSYQDYLAARSNPDAAPEALKSRLSNLGINSILAQWVPSMEAASAEASFFKINQAATPIDPTERRILRARKSASAIASRAITHAGTGHKYWSSFESVNREAIEVRAGSIYKAQYDPPIGGNPVTTLDVPVAGRGYNALPFVFDLVNEANGVVAADTTAKRDVQDALPIDKDGQLTVKYLGSVSRRIERLTGDSPMAMGVHPVVYFYTRSGAFQPVAFIATSRFLENLASTGQLKAFTDVRAEFEEFLVQRKEALGLLVHKFGTGGRSVPWLLRYYERIFAGLLARKSPELIQTELSASKEFAFLTVMAPTDERQSTSGKGRRLSTGTKTAAYFAAALPGCVRCKVCGARVHKNSMHFDHVVRIREGGGDVDNAQVTHPYCDSTIKN